MTEDFGHPMYFGWLSCCSQGVKQKKLFYPARWPQIRPPQSKQAYKPWRHASSFAFIYCIYIYETSMNWTADNRVNSLDSWGDIYNNIHIKSQLLVFLVFHVLELCTRGGLACFSAENVCFHARLLFYSFCFLLIRMQLTLSRNWRRKFSLRIPPLPAICIHPMKKKAMSIVSNFPRKWNPNS